MRQKAASIIVTVIICLLAAGAEAAPLMAFGYLANKSRNGNYDYLETIFPNSFANSVRNSFNAKVVKPHGIIKKLKHYDLRLKKKYKPYEMAEVSRKLAVDYFINGEFIVLPKERIDITINLYDGKENRLFTFSNTGRMEREIFKLVDRIAKIIVDYIGDENLFMSGTIPRGSKIGIFTNLEGEDLNDLYYSFLSGGYRITGIQANSLHNDLYTDIIENFKCITGSQNSFQMITDPRTMRFRYGTWAGPAYYRKLDYVKKIYRTYDRRYFKAESAILERLSAKTDMDNILVIGFNRLKSRAWIRCIDVRSKNLIWMQSGIRGSIPEICTKIIKRMSSGLNYDRG
jgi:hypothetical protein